MCMNVLINTEGEVEKNMPESLYQKLLLGDDNNPSLCIDISIPAEYFIQAYIILTYKSNEDITHN